MGQYRRQPFHYLLCFKLLFNFLFLMSFENLDLPSIFMPGPASSSKSAQLSSF